MMIKKKVTKYATYADKLCLPLALLADKTFLPLDVLILFLKP